MKIGLIRTIVGVIVCLMLLFALLDKWVYEDITEASFDLLWIVCIQLWWIGSELACRSQTIKVCFDVQTKDDKITKLSMPLSMTDSDSGVLRGRYGLSKSFLS